jgi:16S rRNA (adenine1518-N6/adenine1519-N6)-dimethyltransferase
MPRYRPSELIAFLHSLGIRPKKQLSQHFLIDGNIVRKIATFAHIEEGDLVLEIGPGPGALTEVLLERGARVIAVEKDSVFASALEQRQLPRLQVRVADILDCRCAAFGEPVKVVSNIPYHLTTPIIEWILAERAHVTSVTIMVQEEVARRILARPGEKGFGPLSLITQFFSHPQWKCAVPASCFYPRPHVRSAVVHLEMGSIYPQVDPELFLEVIREAFGKRRKTLVSTLAPRFGAPALQALFQELGRPNSVRPEELSLAEWVRLCATCRPLAGR